ncbi:MAG: O-antigen ligase family protein [Armatimonadota bacterium]|nr:O-antigen ligase family protein [Armatimonadota bacterium]
MRPVADWLANATRVTALALLLALPWFAGYMFQERVLIAGMLTLVVGLLACVAAALGARRVGAGVGAIAWPLGGFVAWSALAAVFSVYLHASLVSVLQLGGYVAVLCVFASLFREHRWRRAAWMTIAAAGAVEGIVGLREWTQTAIFQGNLTWRIFGTMYNPNVVAGYLLACLPAGVVVLAVAWHNARSDDERPRLGLIAAGFAVAIPCAALLLTGSRAGMLGAMLGAAVLAIASPNRIRGRWVVAGLVLVVLLAVAAPPIRSRLLSATTQSHSAIFRWYTWVGTARMVAARPVLGFGPGSFEHAYSLYAVTGFTRMAHQTPLQIAAEAGLPALALVLAAVGMLLRRMRDALRRGGMRSMEVAAGLAAMAALGFQNLVDYTWYVPAVGLTLTAAVGLALAAARGEEAPGDEGRPRRWLCWPLALALAGGAIAGGIGLRAEVLAERGRALLGRGRYHMAAGWLRQAAEIDPLDAEIWEDLGQAAAGTRPGGLERAVQARLRTAELNPLRAGNYLGLAWVYEALGEEESALRAARKAIEVHPNYPRAYVTLAQLQERHRSHAEALKTWRALEEVYQSPVGQYQAVKEPTDFSYAYAWIALGREAESEGDLATARDYYQRAAELAGEFARLHREREEVLQAPGTWDEREVREAERVKAEAEAGLSRIQRRGDGRDAP